MHEYLVASNNGWNSGLHSSKISKQQQQLSPVNSVHGLLPPVQACRRHAEKQQPDTCVHAHYTTSYCLLHVTFVAELALACLPEVAHWQLKDTTASCWSLVTLSGSKGNLLAMCNVESATAVVVSPLAIPGRLLSSSMQHSQLHATLLIAMLLRVAMQAIYNDIDALKHPQGCACWFSCELQQQKKSTFDHTRLQS